jgi:Domain of unknown function (DUF4263)
MKRGTVTAEPGKPLRFVEEADTDLPLSAVQLGANLVADCVKEYRATAKNLLEGRYACYAEFAPQHLRNPCSTFIIRCRDGILVRHDLAAQDDAKIRVMAYDESLSFVAPKLSENYLHFGENPEELELDENCPGFVAAVVDSAGIPRESVTYRWGIFTTGQIPDDVQVPKPPARPICLVSITNEFVLEVGGVVAPADAPHFLDGPEVQQFLAHGRLKLPVGWQAIEIYPLLSDDYWHPGNAAVWAELDILAIAAGRNLREVQLNALDPRAETRRRYVALLAEFENLLQGPEEPVHQFLREHPELISPTCDKHWSKVPFGATKSDFVFREPHNDYELVEIESPSRQLFRQDGQQHGDLTHAINQITDWVRYIEDNKRTVEVELG